MKHKELLSILAIGLSIGLLGGVAITAAYSAMPAFDANQIVGRVGETTITREKLAQVTLFIAGGKVLDGELRNSAMIEEAARLKGISVSPEEVDQYVQDTLEFTKNSGTQQQLAEKPHWVLEGYYHDVALMAKLFNISVSTDEARKFYEKNSTLFVTPARVHLINISVDTREQAKEAIKRLQKGQDPRKLAVELSTDPALRAKKGDMGWQDSPSMSELVRNAVFTGNNGEPLKAKQWTGVVGPLADITKQEIHYSVYYVAEITGGKLLKFDEARRAVNYFVTMVKVNDAGKLWYPQAQKQFQWRRLKDLTDPKSNIVIKDVKDK